MHLIESTGQSCWQVNIKDVTLGFPIIILTISWLAVPKPISESDSDDKSEEMGSSEIPQQQWMQKER